MAGKSLRRRTRGTVTHPGGPVVDRAAARVGWWLPETVIAALLAGLVLWAGIGWLVWPIAAGLAVRIAWEWPASRRSARVITAVWATVASRVRRRRAADAHRPTAGSSDHHENRREHKGVAS